MKEHIGKKCLVTTQSYFFGKDGIQYRAVYGELKAVHESGKTLGFIPNRSHANWFIEIGSMIIMGCQVMYFEQTDTVHLVEIEDYEVKDGQVFKYVLPSKIYSA